MFKLDLEKAKDTEGPQLKSGKRGKRERERKCVCVCVCVCVCDGGGVSPKLHT